MSKGSYIKSHVKDSNWIKNLLSERNITQTALGKAMGLDRATINKIIHGRTRLNAAHATKMASVLGIPVEDVLGAAGLVVNEMEGSGKVKVVGSIDEDCNLVMGHIRGPKMVPAPIGVGNLSKMQAARFMTSGTRLNSMDGALIFFGELVPIKVDVLGKLCVLKMSGKSAYLVGVVSRGYKPGTYNVQSSSGQNLAEDILISDASLVSILKF